MTTLKEYTREKHTQIENSPLSKLIMSGAITEKQWDLLVRQKAYIYSTLENLMALPDYVLLAEKVEQDIRTESSTLLVSTTTYINHLLQLNKRLLAAHVYVHYMGEMFGGQVLKKRIPHDNTTHMDIVDKAQAVQYIRMLIDNRHEELKDEANLAFDLMMAIHNDIFTSTTATI